MKVNYFDSDIRHGLLHKIQAAVQAHVEAQIKAELQKVNLKSFGHDAQAIEEVLNYLKDELVVEFKGMKQIWFTIPLYSDYVINKDGVVRDSNGNFVEPYFAGGDTLSYKIKCTQGHKMSVSARDLLSLTFDGFTTRYDLEEIPGNPWDENEAGWDGYYWCEIPGFSKYWITKDEGVHPFWKVKVIEAGHEWSAELGHSVNYDVADADGNPTTSYILTSDDGVKEKYTYHELLKLLD